MTSTNEQPGPSLGHIENEKPVFDTPGVGELADVDDDTAAAAAEQVGTDARQPDEHPYNPDGDPDSDYTAREQQDSRLEKTVPSEDGMRYDRSPQARADDDGRFEALRAAGKDATSLDAGLPAAAPRAGG